MLVAELMISNVVEVDSPGVVVFALDAVQSFPTRSLASFFATHFSFFADWGTRLLSTWEAQIFFTFI